jgi:hypothetical protein
MNTYKGIEFAKGYNKSFAEFKEEFGSTHVFNNIHPYQREKELTKAYEIAVSNNIKEIEVVGAKIVKSNGHPSGTTNKSTATKGQQPEK